MLLIIEKMGNDLHEFMCIHEVGLYSMYNHGDFAGVVRDYDELVREVVQGKADVIARLLEEGISVEEVDLIVGDIARRLGAANGQRAT